MPRRIWLLLPLSVPVHEYLGKMPPYLVPSVPELDYNRSDLPGSGPLYRAADSGTDTKRTPPLEWLAKLSHERPWVHITGRDLPARL